MMLRRYHKRKEEPKKVEEKDKTPRKRTAKKASDEQ